MYNMANFRQIIFITNYTHVRMSMRYSQMRKKFKSNIESYLREKNKNINNNSYDNEIIIIITYDL